MTPASPFAKALTKHAHAPKPITRAKIIVTNIAPAKWKSKYVPVLIIIKNGNVFLPSFASVPGWYSFYCEPVYQCPLEYQAILDIASKLILQDEIVLTRDEGEHLLHAKTKKDDPLLKATNSTSTRNLEKNSVFYAIDSIDRDTGWMLFLHDPQRKSSNTRKFPISTPLGELVRLILEDVKKYPLVLEKDVSVSP